MDFELLYRVLPREPVRWSTEDVVTWLRFIGLDGLCEPFGTFANNSANAHINGTHLKTLPSEHLERELHLRSLPRKKMMKWIQDGFGLFEKFVENKKKTEQLAPSFEDMPMRRIHTSMMRDRVNSTHQHSVSAFEVGHELVELLITPYEGQNASFFSINKDSVIGKSASNQIPVFEVQSFLIVQDSVEREHARIFIQNNNFYLEDLGSKFGTFVRIRDREVLRTNMIIEMGSYLFVVSNVDSEELLLLYSMTEYDTISLSVRCNIGSKGFSIGRRSTADLHLEDQHMSGTHAKITYLGDRFVIEDMSSTNGTWVRFSRPAEKSRPYLLEDKTVFKIGSTSTYTCRMKSKMEVEVSERTLKAKKCLQCDRPETDGLLVPCRHNVTCYNCAHLFQNCPVCRTQISERIKIFT